MLEKLRASNPAYNKSITFISVDWDTHKGNPVTTTRNIPRQATLIVLKGGKEIGRLVAETSEEGIKALLDKAVAAKAASG